MLVCALHADLHFNHAHSLKEKRAVIKPILEGSRRRFEVAASEVDYQDQWQRAGLGFATVSGSAKQVTETLDRLERFIWSFPEVEVLSIERIWTED